MASVPAQVVNFRAQKSSYNWPANFTKFDPNHYATATHADAAITLAGDAARSIILSQIFYSYSGGTVTGSIQVEDGAGNIVHSQDITATGPGVVQFDPPLCGTKGSDLIVTLKDGGSSVVGKVKVNAWLEA